MKSYQNSPINILQIIDKFSMDTNSMHGATRLISYIHLSNKKYNLVTCCLRAPDDAGRRLEQLGMRIIYHEKWKYNLLSIFYLIKIIYREHIDLLHLHGYRSWTFGRFLKALTGIPALIPCHAKDPYYPRIQQVSDLFLARFTDLAIAVSDSAKHFLTDHCRLPSDKIVVLNNCVSLTEFHPPTIQQIAEARGRLGVKSGVKVIGTVTRLYEQKGNTHLLMAAAQVLKVFNDVVFVIVGDGPLLEDLRRLSRQLEIEQHVKFLGFYQKVPAILAAFDIATQASLWEGTPLTILEAMAMAKPIVATAVDGIAGILSDGENALLVRPRDPNDLAQKLIYLLQHPTELQRLGRSAARDSHKYASTEYVTRLDELYQTILENSPRKFARSWPP